jgi:DeoR family transcriptional regulator, fructose operon transcriptional repressor
MLHAIADDHGPLDTIGSSGPRPVPYAVSGAMLAAERQQRILELVRSRRTVSITDLATELNSSASTISRDLASLSAAGWIWRVRGGATYPAGLGVDPPAARERQRGVEAKDAIARRAADLIQEGQVVFLEASTTVAAMGRYLRPFGRLSVVTNDIFLAAELSEVVGIETIVTGGLLRHSTLALVGPMVEQFLDSIHVDIVFTGISALDLEAGLSTGNLLEAETKRKLFMSGQHVVGLADHSKFGKVAFARLGPLTRLDMLITDHLAPADDLDRIRDFGVQVVVAGESSQVE